jgi:2-oxoglutarate dehydrogenase E1 component
MTPKSLLRHPLAASSLRDLTEGSWQHVIDDLQARRTPGRINRLILCSGKIYVDLVSSSHRETSPTVAVCRVEEAYPFPQEDLNLVLNGYPNLEEVVWLQEEPENMGAWEFIGPLLRRLIQGRWPLRYIGRDRSSSPAEGSSARHVHNQEAIVRQAFNPRLEIGQKDMVRIKRN